MTCKRRIPREVSLDDLQLELAITNRPEWQEVLDDMVEHYPQHELELLRFAVAFLLDW